MTTLREAAQQALEALETGGWNMTAAALRAALAQPDPQDAELSAALGWPGGISDPVLDRKTLLQQVAALRAALAQQAEPVAWECKAGGLKPLTQRQYDAQTAATKRHYTRIAPPQRQPLTDATLWGMWVDSPSDVLRFARAVERAHGIKE